MPSDFRSEDVEAAGVSMLAEPPSYSQLYQHGGRQDHDNSDDGSESSLGEPPPYKSGMIYHYILSQIHIKGDITSLTILFLKIDILINPF